MRYSAAVLVTGASGGIGQSICLALSDDGYAILAHYHERNAAARELQETIRGRGGSCDLLQADLAAKDGPAALAALVREKIENRPDTSLHGVVNNAAILLGPPLNEITSDDFDDFFAINTKAPLLLTSALIPLLQEGGGIVNISSASAHLSSPGNILYAMSKSALESMTRNLAEAMAPSGLRVNAVVPGYTDNGHRAFSDPVALAYMASFSPLGGVASPNTVAQAVRFLLSKDADRTTGILLDVSGGSTLGARRGAKQSVRDVISNP